jgi:hypothetical protein
MRRPIALAATLALAGCGAEEPAPEPAPPPPPPSFTDFAGHWNVISRLEGAADSVPSVMTSRPDGGGWMLSLEDRDSIPMRASLSGDSLVLLSAPYQSVLRERVTVQVRTASVLVNGALQGRLVATYNYPDSQQVVVGTISGTRAQH